MNSIKRSRSRNRTTWWRWLQSDSPTIRLSQPCRSASSSSNSLSCQKALKPLVVHLRLWELFFPPCFSWFHILKTRIKSLKIRGVDMSSFRLCWRKLRIGHFTANSIKMEELNSRRLTFWPVFLRPLKPENASCPKCYSIWGSTLFPISAGEWIPRYNGTMLTSLEETTKPPWLTLVSMRMILFLERNPLTLIWLESGLFSKKSSLCRLQL